MYLPGCVVMWKCSPYKKMDLREIEVYCFLFYFIPLSFGVHTLLTLYLQC